MTEPIILSNNFEQSLVPHGTDVKKEEEEESEYSSSEEENEADMPPGPVDPAKCTVGGPGTTGGSAQAPAYFHIQARDSRDKNLTEGGDYVVVKVIPGTTATAGGAKEAEAIVKDNGDGSYTATYSVESRGDYQLTVDINGTPFGGSPFPVFFSPPDEKAAEAAFTDAKGALVDPSTLSAVSDVPLPVISVLGSGAYKAKVKFPEDKDVMERTVIVGDMNPLVTLDQLHKLFSYSGEVEKCEFAGVKNEFSFVTFTDAKEAEKALSLDKLLVIDRQLRVELAQTALDSKGQSGGTQYAALQMEQIQQLQRSQLEQHSLAAQVASMRVQAKQHPGALNPGLPQNSASQKAAALSAIAALSKRLTGSAHGPPLGRERDHSGPMPQKRRREVSPTLRYRGDKRSSPPRFERRRSPVRGSRPIVVLRRRSPSRRRRSASRDRRRGTSRRPSKRSRSREPRRRSRSRDASRRERSRETRKRTPKRDSLKRSPSKDRRKRSPSRQEEVKRSPGREAREESPGGEAAKGDASPKKSVSGGDANGNPVSDAAPGSPGGENGLEATQLSRSRSREAAKREAAKRGGGGEDDRSPEREARKRSRSRDAARRSPRRESSRRGRSREDARRSRTPVAARRSRTPVAARRSRSREGARRISGREAGRRSRSPRSRRDDRGGSRSRFEIERSRRASSRENRSRRDSLASPKRRDRELYSAEDSRSRRRQEERHRSPDRHRGRSPNERRESDRMQRSAKDGREEEKALAAADGTTDSLANGRTGNLAEAQELRERALEALKGSGSGPVNATVGDPMEEDAGAEAEPNGEDETEKRRRHKSKHHKKQKHQRREKPSRKEDSPDEAMPDVAEPVLDDLELPEIDPEFSP